MKRAYKNKDITVLWDSNKCIHSGICISSLPGVFDLEKRPWINIDGADARKIKRVIDRCPSGALSYK